MLLAVFLCLCFKYYFSLFLKINRLLLANGVSGVVYSQPLMNDVI